MSVTSPHGTRSLQGIPPSAMPYHVVWHRRLCAGGRRSCGDGHLASRRAGPEADVMWLTLVNRSARSRVQRVVTQLSRRSVLLGIGAVSAFLAVDLGAVAYANKWIGSGNALTPSTFMEG